MDLKQFNKTPMSKRNSITKTTDENNLPLTSTTLPFCVLTLKSHSRKFVIRAFLISCEGLAYKLRWICNPCGHHYPPYPSFFESYKRLVIKKPQQMLRVSVVVLPDWLKRGSH